MRLYDEDAKLNANYGEPRPDLQNRPLKREKTHD
jgi:hypothetical protein